VREKDLHCDFLRLNLAKRHGKVGKWQGFGEVEWEEFFDGVVM
jgi:hypothetical protein